MRRFLLVVPVVVLLACGGDDDDEGAGTVATVTGTSADDAPVSTPPSSSSTSTSGPSTTRPLTATPLEPVDSTGTVPGSPIDPAMPLVVAAVDDLAERLGIDAGDVTVIDARAVTWGDSSLGCPQPGMMYLQRLVDGVLVILEAAGRRYEYHGGDPLFVCENPKAPSGGD